MNHLDTAFLGTMTAVILSTRHIPFQKLFGSVTHQVRAKSRSRFTEQFFSLCYFTLSTLAGIYISRRLNVWNLSVSDLLDHFQHPQTDKHLKYFYLVQTAFWFQEVLVLLFGLEKSRPDRRQLICHHAVTIALIRASYFLNLTDFGLMIIAPHDASDAMLSTAKLLNYVDSSLATPAWLAFTVCWIYGRHYLMIRTFWTAVQFYQAAGDLNLPTSARTIQVVCLVCLGILQALNIYWLLCIFRGIKQAITAKEGARDLRSDDEDDGGDEDDDDKDL